MNVRLMPSKLLSADYWINKKKHKEITELIIELFERIVKILVHGVIMPHKYLQTPNTCTAYEHQLKVFAT